MCLATLCAETFTVPWTNCVTWGYFMRQTPIDMTSVEYFCLHQTQIALTYPSTEVARAFQMVLAGFQSKPVTEGDKYTIEYAPQTKKYSVYNTVGIIAEYTSIDNLLAGLEWILVKQAIAQAQDNTTQPTLICCKTTIGFGSPNKAGTAAVHGAPLGEDEVALSREQLGWHHPAFEIPEDIKAQWDARERGAELADSAKAGK